MRKLPWVVCLFAPLLGCEKLSAAGFWGQFPDGQLAQNISQQGGRGGWRAMHWNARAGETVSAQKLKSFAAEQGWKFLSEEKVSADGMKSWVGLTGKAVFPLGYDGFAPGKNDSAYDRFPRWMTSNAILMTLDSGWITAIGGIDKTAYGYVLVAEDGKALSVYHLWGE